MSTYAEIVSILQNWNEDDSTEFSNVIPDIISRAEDRIFRIVPALIDHRTLETGNLVSGNELVTTSATDIRGIRYIYLTVNTVKTFLEQRTDEYLEDYWISGNRGLCFTHSNNKRNNFFTCTNSRYDLCLYIKIH